MMLDFLGAGNVAGRVTAAVSSFTPDANLSTSQVGDAIAHRAQAGERV
jgi:hypothetical protein